MSEHPDSQTIAAIRSGQPERYRELIERYERQVYAVAWSHLGDAALAEDAAQEAFIKAYRHLGWLRDPARFAGWVTRIARSISVNLGIRHRRELRRQERWAVDPATHDAHEGPEESAAIGAETAPPRVSIEVLQAALKDLPSRHRECLVLHYLEHRSIGEAATALDISQGAFRVRLHRARIALRGRLERQLAASLGQLAPRRRLAPGIMSSVALKAAGTDPAGFGPSLLGGLFATAAKLVPATFLLALVPIALVAAAVGASAWITRREERNYRDPAGPESRLYLSHRHRALLALLLVVVLVGLGERFGVGLYAGVSDGFLVGLRWAAALILGLSSALLLAAGIREYQLQRSPALLARSLLWFAFQAGLALSVVAPLSTSFVPWLLPLVLLATAFTQEPGALRFDDSLFLRATRGLLPEPASAPPLPPIAAEQLFAFGQALARRRLVTGFRRERGGYWFRLSPVERAGLYQLTPWIRRQESAVHLGYDGSVTARLGRVDSRALQRFQPSPGPQGSARDDLGSRVSTAVSQALAAFRQGNDAEVWRALGQRSDQEIFKVEPARTAVVRFRRYAAVLAALLMVALHARSFWTARTEPPVASSRPQPTWPTPETVR